MSALHDALVEYLATRRALGTQLAWPESSLRNFVDFVEAEGADFLTSELATRWAFRSVGVQRATLARRLAIVRAFAVWLQAVDARTQIPPMGLLPAKYRRPVPHIYSNGEIASLMKAAGQLRSASGLRGATYKTIIGLLAATGLRPGEVLKLDVGDVDLVSGILTVRESKLRKSRFVPLDRSVQAALLTYASLAMRFGSGATAPHSLSRSARRASRDTWFGSRSADSARLLACALGGTGASDAAPACRTFATHSPHEDLAMARIPIWGAVSLNAS
jgi:integrase